MIENKKLNLLKRKQMLEKVGLSRMTVEKMINNGDFPRPVNPTTRDLAWVEYEIDEWILGLIKARASETEAA